MRFEVQAKEPIDSPKESVVRRSILALRSYGRSSYASLTDAGGSYVQVGGGGVSCLLERFDSATGNRWRAHHDKPNPTRPDGTVLVFSGGEMPLRSDEWFMADQVVEVFLAFLHQTEFPDFVQWREAPEIE